MFLDRKKILLFTNCAALLALPGCGENVVNLTPDWGIGKQDFTVRKDAGKDAAKGDLESVDTSRNDILLSTDGHQDSQADLLADLSVADLPPGDALVGDITTSDLIAPDLSVIDTSLPDTASTDTLPDAVQVDAALVEASVADAALPDAADPCANVLCTTPPNSCYLSPGTCSDGACSYTPKTNGETCDDLDACTTDDVCDGDGLCNGTPSCPPVITNPLASPERFRSTRDAIVLLTVAVTDADDGVGSVTVDLTDLGLGGALPMYDDGSNGDQMAGDGLYSLELSLLTGSVANGDYSLVVTATDQGGLSSTGSMPLTVIPNPLWRRLMGPSERMNATAIYDEANQRVIMFGGSDQNWDPTTNEVWSWTATGGWSQLSPTGTPPAPRNGHAMIYDPVANRAIVFGGWDGVDELNDLWQLSLTPGQEAWLQLTPGGTAPDARDGIAFCYDPGHHRMVVFGGFGNLADEYVDDLWLLDLTQGSESWSPLNWVGLGPDAVWGSAMAYDATNQRAVLFGGYDNNGDELDQLFSLDLDTTSNNVWTKINETGPAARDSHVLVHDPSRSRFILIGGWDFDDVWELSSGAGSESWTELRAQSGAQSSLILPATAVLPAQDTLWLFGGYDYWSSEVFADLWLIGLANPGTDWQAAYALPPARFAPTLGFETSGDTLLLYGGSGEYFMGMGFEAVHDLWALDLTSTGGWVQSTIPTDPGFYPRWGSSHIFDDSRQMFLINGGTNTDVLFGDSWSLYVTPGSESLVENPGPQLWNWQNVAIDTANDRAILIYDLRALDLSTQVWSTLSPTGTPPANLESGVLAYDAPNQRMVYVDTSNPANYQVWALDTSTPGSESWTPITPTGTAPTSSGVHVSTTSMRAGSSTMYAYRGNLWKLDMSAGSEAWAELTVEGTPPDTRQSPGFIFDPAKNRILLFGGQSANPNQREHNDLWEIAYIEE